MSTQEHLRGEDLRTGDRVTHITAGDGTVTQNNDSEVHIRFDHNQARFSHRRKGRHPTGVFPYVWFEQNPNWIFRRRS